jgi:hypothetical protein
MSDPSIRVPASVAGDSTDVSTALEVAGALWVKGSPEESLRWLKRAVEAAGEVGDAARADELAGAVADLETSIATKAAPSAASAASKPPPPPTTASRAPAAPTAAASARPAPPPLPARSAPSRAPGRSLSTPASRAQASIAPLPVVPAAFMVPAGTSLRVSVKVSARDPELLVVRLLPEGRPPPPGAREGTLVLAEEEADAHGHANGAKGSAVS